MLRVLGSDLETHLAVDFLLWFWLGDLRWKFVFILSGFLWDFEAPLEFGTIGCFFIKFFWMRCVDVENLTSGALRVSTVMGILGL